MIKNKKKIIFLSIVVFLCVAVFALYKYGENYNVDSTKETATEKGNAKKDAINSTKNQDSIDDSGKETKNQLAINELTKEPIKQASVMVPDKVDTNYVEYIVKPGDILSKIYSENIVSYTFSNAQRLIIKENNLSSTGILKVGMKLKIPKPVDNGYIKHKVTKGESIGIIAKKYMGKKSLVDEISQIEILNGRENTKTIEVGQVLLIQKNN
jgi:LysM repeat protein